MPEAITVSHLYKLFGHNAADAMRRIQRGDTVENACEAHDCAIGVIDASFSINVGEIFVVMGLSGSGKSTLVRMLNRLITPTAGSVVIDDQDIIPLPMPALRALRRRKMAMVFQSFALMPHMNALDNVAFGLNLAGVDAAERHETSLRALAQVGLADWAHAYPHELSGGMQQRVGLARALANDPAILLMDEAFSALDPLIRTEMQDELLRLQSENSRTIVFISHDLDEAIRIGDRLAIMESGRIVQIGTPEDILHNPSNAYVRSFFRNFDATKILTAGDIMQRKQVTVIQREGTGAQSAAKMLADNERDYGYVLDRQRRFVGVLSAAALVEAIDRGTPFAIEQCFVPDVAPIRVDQPVNELFTIVAQSDCGVPVVDETNTYRGVLTKTALLAALGQRHTAPQQ